MSARCCWRPHHDAGAVIVTVTATPLLPTRLSCEPPLPSDPSEVAAEAKEDAPADAEGDAAENVAQIALRCARGNFCPQAVAGEAAGRRSAGQMGWELFAAQEARLFLGRLQVSSLETGSVEHPLRDAF